MSIQLVFSFCRVGSDSNELTQLQQRLEAELEKLAVRLRTVEERLGVEPEKPTSEMAEDQLTPVPVEERVNWLVRWSFLGDQHMKWHK